METNCECQYIMTLTDKIIHRQFYEMKGNFNHVPSIHEVDEEETDEEYIYDLENTTSKDNQQITDVNKDVAGNNSLYSNESFCSTESCDESEGINITLRSSNDSRFLPHVIDYKCNKENNSVKEKKFKSIIQNNESINSIRYKSSISEDKNGTFNQKRSKRKNMSFTDEEMRKIERENQLLLRKIMAQQKPKEKIFRTNVPQSRLSSSAINRKNLQKKIESENILLLQRIQRTKSRVTNTGKN